MVNQSKVNDPRFWKKWGESGAVGNINGMNAGESYAFFDCMASKEEIESELPSLLSQAQTPSGLEASLMEVKDLEKSIGIDPDLLQFVRENEIYTTFPSKYKDQMKTAKPIKMTDLKYIMKASYPNARNEDTANQLGDVMNVVYMRYGDGKPFNTAVVCKIDREYYFKD